ncbi:MAG: hypothetical protein K2G45_01180, partial [Lachnospiraceae bacterium]|nr:hypothetical protein [Lachnospiraceae bacterium]
MIHNIYRLRKVLNFIYQYLFTCLFIIFACSIIIHVPVNNIYFVELFILYTISYISRDLAPNLLVTLICHALPLAGIYLYGADLAVFIVMALIGFYLFTDTWVYMRMGRMLRPVDDMPWPAFLMSIIFFLYGYYVRDNMLRTAAYIIPVICIVIYLINVY